LESIEELHPPDSSAPDAAHTQWHYLLLVYRYVEGKSIQEIMSELGYSRRQYFREQAKALALLAALLSEKLPQPAQSSQASDDTFNNEVGRLTDQQGLVHIDDIVKGALDLIEPLAQEHNVALECVLDTPLPSIYGNRTVLRQVFLRGLSDLVKNPGTRRVLVNVYCTGQRMVAKLTTEPGSLPSLSSTAEGVSTHQEDPPRRLVELAGGRWLKGESRASGSTWQFDFPIPGKRLLLVVEDNQGIVLTFRRYLAGYNYIVLGATSGVEAIQLAREAEPAVITLDVMMPAQDGWEILKALKNDPLTQSIPVIICSVLDDPELARSLGAAANLCKPVAQAELLAALDACVDATQ
jgi:CheY-like chemotaxis protein